MKKIYLTLFIPFISSLLFAQHNDYFYYYKGEKQYLELNKDYVFIQTTGKDISQKSEIFKNSNNIKFRQYATSTQLRNAIGKRTNLYWAEIELTKNKGKNYKEQIALLKKDKNIEVVAPYFKSKSDDKIGLSNFFYVKIKQLKDTTTLKTFSDKHRTLIVKQDKFMPLWFLMSCTKATNKNALEMANLYYESKLFKYAEPDLMVDDIYTCTDDPFFSSQWSLKNTGQNGGTAEIDIKICDAWKISKGKNVTVAVIDQGIELDHPDLQDNIHPLSYDTENGTSPSIVRGRHGTVCAGIVGAVDNNIGISGVAPDCQLMSISDDLFISPSTKQRLANGINWAVQNGADVISNSWGSTIQYQIIDDAITNALTNGRNGLGCVVVFAAGNHSSIKYPSNSNPNILTVGAISNNGNRASFSNYGSQLDVVAPGVNIYTTDLQGNSGYNPPYSGSDISDRDYTSRFSGTSAAAPHVSGVAALILSVRPDLTEKQVRNIIEQTAQKVDGYSYTTHSNRPNGDWNNQMGYGLVNALKAVKEAFRNSGADTICGQEFYTIHNAPSGVSFSWQVSPNLQIINSTNNSVTVKSIGIGSGYVKVIAGGLEIKKEVEVSLDIPEFSIECIGNCPIGFNSLEPHYQTGVGYMFFASPPSQYYGFMGVTATYTWSYTNINNNYHYPIATYIGGFNDIQPVITFQDPGSYRIEVEVIHPICQTTRIFTQLIQVTNNGFFSMYPNPASGSVTIQLAESNLKTVSKTIQKSPYKVHLYNLQGHKLRSVTGKENKVQIPLHNLSPGLYIVQVIKNGKVYQKKLLVE